MEYRKGVVITGKNTMAVSDHCPIPEEPQVSNLFDKLPLNFCRSGFIVPCFVDLQFAAAII